MTIDRVRDFCRTLEGTTEDVKRGSDLVFSVGGKIYAVVCLDPPHTLGSSARRTRSPSWWSVRGLSRKGPAEERPHVEAAKGEREPDDEALTNANSAALRSTPEASLNPAADYREAATSLTVR